MKETFRKCNAGTVLLTVMLLVYISSVCMINFLAPPSYYDSDMYTDMRYAMEAWGHRSVFPEGWVFGNQLYAASTPVLAALLYGVIGSPHLAMGLASSFMALFVLVSFQWMLRPAVESRQGRLAGSLVLMAAMLYFGDAYCDTGGWSLLFTMCSYYACYAVSLFLAYGCYLRSESLRSVGSAGILILTCCLSFCMGIQSLRQTAVMTLPLLGVEFLRIMLDRMQKKTIEKKSLIVAGVISVANIAGLVVSKGLNLEQVQIIGELKLTPVAEYLPNLKNGILLALSLVVNYDAGGYLVLSGLLLACVLAVPGILKGIRSGQNSKKLVLAVLLLLSVLAILAVQVMTTMRVRSIYYFALFPLLAYFVSCFFDSAGKWGRAGVLVCLAALFLVTCVQELTCVFADIRNRENESAYEISSYLLENGYTTVYAGWNDGVDVVIASDWKLQAGFWEDQDDPFFFYKYLCNPEVFRADSDSCVYLFRGIEDAQLGVEKAKTKGIGMVLLRHFPECDVYLYTAPENIMEAFW